MDAIYLLILCAVNLLGVAVGFTAGWWLHKTVTAKYLLYLLTMNNIHARVYSDTTTGYAPLVQYLSMFAVRLKRQWQFPWMHYNIKPTSIEANDYGTPQ